MEKYIIDTNFFFNLEIKTGLGNNPKEIIIKLNELIYELNKKKLAEFYMPPLIVDEFLTFVSKTDQFVEDYLKMIIIKAPDIYNIEFNAMIFNELIQEARERSYKGMKVAEEIIDQAAKKMIGQNNLSKIEYQKQIGEYITRLRDRYRQATRVKFLDSVADFDLIVLAKELNGYIITSDEGVLIWARKFGVKEIIPDLVKRRLTSLCQD